MKTKSKPLLLAMIPIITSITAGIFMLPSSCKKEVMLPLLWNFRVTQVTESSFVGRYEIISDGGAPVTERGVCWTTGETPTTADNKSMDGQGTGDFASTITGLTPTTLYHVRAYATNRVGTTYGGIVPVHTWSGSVKDIDSNLYYTIIIDTRHWMGNNLKTKRLNDGTGIEFINNAATASGITTPAYGYYENQAFNYNAYGALYNGYAVQSGKLCPAGWHVPSDDEWHALIAYLGESLVAGGKMKEAGLEHWTSTNKGATNESGFTALPGGSFLSTSDGCGGPGCYGIGYSGSWWSATPYMMINLGSDSSGINFGTGLAADGRSVRCIRDN